MHLEILQCQPSQPSHKKPILFIHGAFAGAWCWEEYFLPYFASQGYPAYALSLRGHGESEGIENLAFTSLDNYISDVRTAIETIGEEPILVGHSMGGMIIQKYLEKHSSPAAVLMNSVPPTGLWTTIFYMAWSDPMLFSQLFLLQNLSPRFATPSAVKHALLSEDVSDDKLHKFFHHVQGESQRVMLDMMGLNLPHLAFKGPIPLLVLGAEKDAFLPPSVVEWTGHLYDAPSHVFPKTAHAMMLENNWQEVADYMIDWLEKTVPAKPSEVKTVVEAVKKAVEPVVAAAKTEVKAAESKPVVPEVKKAVEPVVEKAVEAVKPAAEAAKTEVKAAESKPVVPEVKKAVEPVVEKAAEVVKPVIEAAKTEVKAAESKPVVPAVKKAVEPVVEKAVEVVKPVIEAAKTEVKAAEAASKSTTKPRTASRSTKKTSSSDNK
ncbi:MAG: alpha/beta fold hydrolase [Thiotrichaceae bacterium]|nr:alpha/beta fold hydrolase [Thiotrichaceae bacterium]